MTLPHHRPLQMPLHCSHQVNFAITITCLKKLPTHLSSEEANSIAMDRLGLKRRAASISSAVTAASTCACLDEKDVADEDDECDGKIASTVSEATTTSRGPKTEQPKTYKRSDFGAFNLLANRPVWLFDVEKKAMWWANDAAVELWGASDLQALLSRDFSDMSEATCKRLEEMMAKFRRGERCADQVWCFCLAGAGADSSGELWLLVLVLLACWPAQVY